MVVGRFVWASVLVTTSVKKVDPVRAALKPIIVRTEWSRHVGGGRTQEARLPSHSTVEICGKEILQLGKTRDGMG